MTLFLDGKDCNVLIMIYHNNNVIINHDRNTQSLTFPVVPVLRKHLGAIIDDKIDNIAKLVNDIVINIDLNPIIGAFAYAAIEHVVSLKYTIKSIKHIKDTNCEYLFKCSEYPSHNEIFAIEILTNELYNEFMVGIHVNKINNIDIDVYYNGLKIEPLSAIVLIEYWNLKMA